MASNLMAFLCSFFSWLFNMVCLLEVEADRAWNISTPGPMETSSFFEPSRAL